MTQYVYSPRYIDAPVARYQDVNGDGDTTDLGDSVLLYTADANFNVTGLINATTGAVVERYAYDPYGKTLYLDANWAALAQQISTFNNTNLYTSRPLDVETGVFYYRARYNDVNLMRFLGTDPLAADENLYRYCGGNPVQYADRSGLVTVHFIPGRVALVASRASADAENVGVALDASARWRVNNAPFVALGNRNQKIRVMQIIKLEIDGS